MNINWIKLSEQFPEPHARYLLKRNNIIFTATPCYGMHEPWWIIKTLVGEAEPQIMRKDLDEWAKL